MWDLKSHKSRGYGFIAFSDINMAKEAINQMQGVVVGNRPIRLNWAQQKNEAPSRLRHKPVEVLALDYSTVLQQTGFHNTTVYLGNLGQSTTDADLYPIMASFGVVLERKIQSERGFAFFKLDTHESAANAICSIIGMVIHGRNVRASWGKDKVSLSLSTNLLAHVPRRESALYFSLWNAVLPRSISSNYTRNE
jgi:nucleolysin TIA-1/TIAR